MSAGPTLRITVVEVPGRTPIPGATVVLTGTGTGTVTQTTDGNGQTTFVIT